MFCLPKYFRLDLEHKISSVCNTVSSRQSVTPLQQALRISSAMLPVGGACYLIMLLKLLFQQQTKLFYLITFEYFLLALSKFKQSTGSSQRVVDFDISFFF